MEYRDWQPGESAAIEKLFVSAFTQSDSEEEGAMVGRLARDLMASADRRDLYGFVAIEGEELVGAIFFSRLTFESDIEAFILSPVAVNSAHQGMGTGQALIKHGLQQIRNRGVVFVTTYGDPAYYSKVGFLPISQDDIAPPHTLSQPEGWLGQSLTDERSDNIPGRCICVKALDDPAYW